MSSKPRLSVICAPPNGFNPGMTSVDIAVKDIAAELGADVTFWRMWDQSEWREPLGGSHLVDSDRVYDVGSGMTYTLSRGRLDRVMDADAVVFWGDFLHMEVYLRQTADVLARRMGCMSLDAAFDTATQHYLLRDWDVGSLGRVMTFGSTLSFNTAHAYASSYGKQLARFIGGVRRAWFRDPYSATVAQSFRSDDLTCKAPDAAFLLPSAPRGETSGQLGVFIGRSDLKPESVAAFGKGLAQELDLQPRWIPWGQEPGFWPMDQRRRFRAAWPGLEHGTAHPSPSQIAQTVWGAALGRSNDRIQPTISELFDLIASCSVILTDTYHLAVNAWRLGTPAICLTDGDHQAWNVNAGEPGNPRDKRYDLYSQLDALPLLVDGRRLRSVRDHTAQAVAERLNDGTVVRIATSRVEKMAASSRSTLLSELRGILSR